MRWSTRRVHFWTATFIGLAFTMWVISGLIMMMGVDPASGLSSRGPVEPLATATVSPGEAIALVGGDDASAASLRVAPMGEWWTYQIRVDGRWQFVDMHQGTVINIDQGVARALAQHTMEPSLTVTNAAVVESHDWTYFNGSLPVYRFEFDNGTTVHVNPANGSVRAVDRRTLFFTYSVLAHDFSLIGTVFRLPGGHDLLWIISLGSLLVIGTGYILAYPQLRPRRRKAQRPS